MIPILLIAKGFVRQNRWLLLALVAWPFLMAALFWSPTAKASQSDIAEMLQQESFYGLVVVTFLASSAIYNEKRSRRIVGVLSKGISRAQYLLGLALGAACFATTYFAATGLSVTILTGYSEHTLKFALALLLRGCVSSFWMASLALLSSIFLFPFIAAALTAAIAFIPAMALHRNPILAPIGELMREIQVPLGGRSWLPIVISLAESSAFIVLAAAAFARRDVTVSVE